MGIWSILEKDENAELISNVERELRSDRTSGAMEFLSRFMYLKTYPESRVIEPFELYASAVKVLMEKKTLGSDSYTVAMQYGEEIYSAMFPFGEKTADFEELCTIFLEMFDRDGVVCGLQSSTSSLPLGFDQVDREILVNGKKKKVSNYPFLHLGICVHVDVIKRFLDEQGVMYQKG